MKVMRVVQETEFSDAMRDMYEHEQQELGNMASRYEGELSEVRDLAHRLAVALANAPIGCCPHEVALLLKEAKEKGV